MRAHQEHPVPVNATTMKTCGQSNPYGKSEARSAPHAFHLRRRRQWYGARPISQDDLARLAGVSARTLRRMEETRRLPRAVEYLLRLAIALEISIEALLEPRHVRELQHDIERRRAAERRSAQDAA